MGWSLLDDNKPKSKAYIGDDPFDAIAECFTKVRKLYQREWKRKPTLAELLGTVEAVLDAQLPDHTSDGESAELVEIRFKTRKIPRRQTYAVGDILQAKMKGGDLIFGRLFDIDHFAPLVGVYDSRGMSPLSISDIITRPLIVKVCPIHPQTLEHREWLVVGNAKLKPSDKKHPRGPRSISGNNNHLEMAEYFYGLRNPKYYDRDEWIVRKKG